MKKLLSLLLAGSMLLGLSACGGGSTATPAPSQAPAASAPAQSQAPAETADPSSVRIGILIPGSPTDGGFCQQGAEAGKALQQLGYQVDVVEAVTAEEIKSESENMAADGYRIVFGHGAQCTSPMAEISGDYPDTCFITLGGEVVTANQFPVCVCAEESCYVLGIVAAMLSKTGTISYTLGGDFPSYVKYTNAMKLGARSVNPDIKALGAVLSSTNANECYETTMNQINSGADFILSNSNEGQAGAMKAVTESDGVYTFGCLGNFFDMAPGKVLGNIIGDYSIGYDNATKAIMDGTAKAEIMYLTIANGCITVDWNPDVEMPDDVKAAVEQTMEDIKSGKIDVPNEYEQDQAAELLASYK